MRKIRKLRRKERKAEAAKTRERAGPVSGGQGTTVVHDTEDDDDIFADAGREYKPSLPAAPSSASADEVKAPAGGGASAGAGYFDLHIPGARREIGGKEELEMRRQVDVQAIRELAHRAAHRGEEVCYLVCSSQSLLIINGVCVCLCPG